jgi:hypothetical protein
MHNIMVYVMLIAGSWPCRQIHVTQYTELEHAGTTSQQLALHAGKHTNSGSMHNIRLGLAPRAGSAGRYTE